MYTYSVDISIHYKKYIHKGYSEAKSISGRSNSLSMAGNWPLGRNMHVKTK